MPVSFTYEISEAEVRAAVTSAERSIESRLNEAVDKILDLVENVQIKSYTAGGNPARPAGSDYVRTLTLQRSSEKQRTERKLPVIAGVWRANEGQARYAPYVIGSRADQATIHRGRWKSEEEVVKVIEDKGPGIIKEQLSD